MDIGLIICEKNVYMNPIIFTLFDNKYLHHESKIWM